MSANPYQAPQADLQRPEYLAEVPVHIARKIKRCWIVGIVASMATVLGLIGTMMGRFTTFAFDEWALIDIAIMLALSFGVFKKSRTCAILMVAFYVYGRYALLAEGFPLSGMPLALVFMWFFIQGVVGTFQFHRWKRENQLTH